jgi:hypothetical protein
MYNLYEKFPTGQDEMMTKICTFVHID